MKHNRLTWKDAFWCVFLLMLIGYLIPGGIKLYNRSSNDRIVTYCEYKLRKEKKAEYENFIKQLDSLDKDKKDIEIENHLKFHNLHYVTPDTMTAKQYRARKESIERFLFDYDVRVLRIEHSPARIRFLFDIYNEYEHLTWLTYFPNGEAKTAIPEQLVKNYADNGSNHWSRILDDHWAVMVEPHEKPYKPLPNSPAK